MAPIPTDFSPDWNRLGVSIHEGASISKTDADQLVAAML